MKNRKPVRLNLNDLQELRQAEKLQARGWEARSDGIDHVKMYPPVPKSREARLQEARDFMRAWRKYEARQARTQEAQ